jgi:hypothetical protein
MNTRIGRFSLIFLLLLIGSFTFAQEEEVATLDVYLDCSSCDNFLIRQKLGYVNYTNDPFTAHVHLFITRQQLGSGGDRFQLKFIGKKQFEGDQVSLQTDVPPNSTSLENQEILIKSMKNGLVSFLAGTLMKDNISVSVRQNDGPPKPLIDPAQQRWNNWIFELYGSLDWRKESARETTNFRYGLDIDHITPDWRVRINPSFFYREQFVENNGESILSVRRSNSSDLSIVKSLTEHWSAGMFSSAYHSTYSNIKLGTWLAPAVEYNIFPYSDVPLKEFTIAYRVGWRHYDYIQETIYLKTEEDLIRQMLEIALRIRQPWGSVVAGLEGSNFMADWTKNRVEMNTHVSFRVMKGLSVNFGGFFEVINDQISLPRGGASLEEILLGQAQLATDFEASVNFGFSYTFGALYNNVINTRL